MVDSKWLMSVSAVVMFVLGTGASFLPHETIAYAGARPTPMLVLVVQALGALYLGFAVLDWMARSNRIGGIYSRPIALGNFLHFAVLALALVRALMGGPRTPVIAVLAITYGVLALGFASVLFSRPRDPEKPAA